MLPATGVRSARVCRCRSCRRPSCRCSALLAGGSVRAACASHLASGRLGGATGLLLGDQIAELGLGVGASGCVVAGELLGLGLRRRARSASCVGLVDACRRGSSRSSSRSIDEGVEFVGGDVAGAQRDPSELVALQHVVDVGGVLEQRAERRGAGADERAHGHVTEVARSSASSASLPAISCLGFDDLLVEGGSSRRRPRRSPRRSRVACSSSRSSSSTMPSTSARLLIDRAGRRDLRRHRRDDEGHHDRDGRHAQEAASRADASYRI